MFVPGEPLHPSLLFVSKAEACPSPRRAPLRCSPLEQAPELTRKILDQTEKENVKGFLASLSAMKKKSLITLTQRTTRT
jgi:hypothetical protein